MRASAADSDAVDLEAQADWMDPADWRLVVPVDPAEVLVDPAADPVDRVVADLAAAEAVAVDQVAVDVEAVADAAGRGLLAIATATRRSSAIERAATTIASPDLCFTRSATRH
jgi:hypothetical protein